MNIRFDGAAATQDEGAMFNAVWYGHSWHTVFKVNQSEACRWQQGNCMGASHSPKPQMSNPPKAHNIGALKITSFMLGVPC